MHVAATVSLVLLVPPNPPRNIFNLKKKYFRREYSSTTHINASGRCGWCDSFGDNYMECQGFGNALEYDVLDGMYTSIISLGLLD